MRLTLSGIQNSSVNLYLRVRRVVFFVDQSWLRSIHRMNYGEEMRVKFIAGLHQNSEFERKHLQDILNFRSWIDHRMHFISNARNELNRFSAEYKSFYAIIVADGLNIIDANHPVIKNTKSLIAELDHVYGQLDRNERLLSQRDYRILESVADLKLIQFSNMYSLSEYVSIADVFDKSPITDHFFLSDLIRTYNRVQTKLNLLNVWLNEFISHFNHKIIAGIAGTGKTHTVGFIVEQIEKQGDFVIFLNAKAFNGDNVNFDNCFHQRLFVPQGYNIFETLQRLNKFAKKKRKRLFIIFDALNETTTTTLGFSRIWEDNLQPFINLVKQFPYLYFISTLRTSYIEEIWSTRPEKIAVLSGVDEHEDTLEMCVKYFNYYKIEVENIGTADVTHFAIPLLLDLFCKMTNGDRSGTKRIKLDGYSYKQIFEGYVEQLVKDVKKRRNLMLADALIEGLHVCSGRFMGNIEGTLSLKDFVQSFDTNMQVKNYESLAQPMLEGNLVFIKERIGPMKEIVKHTQQLIGGYLLATYLNNLYPDVEQLVASTEFDEKINGKDASLHHQLRLDIIKFLVVYKPEIINFITERQAFQEGWWYLYNGYDATLPDIPLQLLDNSLSLEIMPYIMQVSIGRWFDPNHASNFKYISQYLGRFGTWESDANWTFYIYNNAELFFNFIEQRKRKLLAGEIDESKEPIVALLVAFINATTVRKLRDEATIYLIEFGKLFCLELLEIGKACASLSDSYIYQRLIHAMYGVALIKQHDSQFLQEQLPVLADALFRLQFSKDASHPVYDYIVIDSIKHILDLAVYKGVWDASEEDLRSVGLYLVPNLPKWISPSDEVIQKVQDSTEMNPPSPIGMDFAIYTIPRLIDDPEYNLKEMAIANVLKRVLELGYKEEDDVGSIFTEDSFKSFFYGENLARGGKVDRLGKKYNWKAFFDYAGYLLQQGKLDTFNTFAEPKSGFKRLSDVAIDISLPNANYSVSEQFYYDELIPSGKRPEGWQMEIKITSVEPHLTRKFNGDDYVMLKGVVEQRVDQGYEVRSFIMVESCFIEKSGDFQVLKEQICSKIFNWDHDLHLSPSYSTGIYFGEYYWADNQVLGDIEHYSVKTGSQIMRKRKVRNRDLMDEMYDFSENDLGQERDFAFDEYIGLTGEDSLSQYLNESNSDPFNGHSMYIPTSKLGMYLGLKADPSSGLILDADLRPCLLTVEYELNLIKNEATYLRADLLKKYLNEHNYAVMYQNKQHSYDLNSPHNRCMKYFVIDEF